MKFETVAEGRVCTRLLSEASPSASGPRVVVAGDGSLVCSYMVQSKSGINDFVPMLARSRDGGKTWQDEGAVWQGLRGRFSLFVNLSRDASGRLYLFGSRYRIDAPGEPNWCDATQGLKENDLVWAASEDHGRSWTEPCVIPMPIPGASEAPGPLTVTRGGVWVGPYSPYNTFDPHLKVDREQVVVMTSRDKGKSWGHASMLRFAEKNSGGAEAWCVELADGRLLGTSWHIDHTRENPRDYPNKYALSRDGGATWSPTRSTGTLGHTTALCPLADGGALFLHVVRRPVEQAGLWLALVRPTEADFGIVHNQRVWAAGGATKSGKEAEANSWTDFNFGEPSVTVLPDGSLFMCYWYMGKSDAGIGWVKMRMVG